MFVPHLLAGYVLAQSASPGAYTLTAGRTWAMVAMLVGTAGAITGGLALANRTGTVTRRRRAVAALVAGSVGTVVGGLVVAAADGGPGTGYGIVGGAMALPVGLAAIVLGGLALARLRRAASTTAGMPG
jgi:hypothetical protein